MKHIAELFDNMDKWRHLPSYQLERRADIFFSIYLSDLLLSKFGVQTEGVIPEFPIRIGSIQSSSDSNQSFKVDYLAKAKGVKKVILIELKTDDSSIREEQDRYLEEAKNAGLVKLFEGLREIYQATNSKKKYQHLFRNLQDMGFITLGENGTFTISQADYEIEIAYIQPNNREGKGTVISFQDAARVIGKNEDELSRRFSDSLLIWATVNAGDE